MSNEQYRMKSVLLPAHRIKNKGLQVIEEDPALHTNIREAVYDADKKLSRTKVI